MPVIVIFAFIIGILHIITSSVILCGTLILRYQLFDHREQGPSNMKTRQILFMIQTDVKRIDYPNTEWNKFKDMRLVWATDSIEARDKLQEFWNSQAESYSHWYEVTVRSVTEAIQ